MNWKIALLYITPQHCFSRFSGWLSRRKVRWFKLFSIRWFIRTYGVNVAEAAVTDLDAYPTFNDFFIRKLRPDARPIVRDAQAIASPVDANISEFGAITQGKLIQAKGHDYTLADLVASAPMTQSFLGGNFCTLYLAPQHYHRVHMPITGKLQKMIYVPGRLFSVNQQSAQHVDRLFARNERVICEFATEIGPMAMILVGACQVGNICTPWFGQVAPNNHCNMQEWDYAAQNITLERGEEMGYFTLGSTVILLFGANTMKWDNSLRIGNGIKLGEKIGNI